MTTFTSKKQEQVKEFHKAFNHPTQDSPTPMDLERAVARTIWTGEELIEFLHASSNNIQEFVGAYYTLLDGLTAAYKKSSVVEFPKTDLERVTAQSDALVDADYFINGSYVELGVDSAKVFDIVQEANMSKLFTDEKGNKYAKYREDGKILKSPEFFSPEERIEAEIIAQSAEYDEKLEVSSYVESYKDVLLEIFKVTKRDKTAVFNKLKDIEKSKGKNELLELINIWKVDQEFNEKLMKTSLWEYDLNDI